MAWWKWSRSVAASAESAMFSERYGCPHCGISLPEMEPRHFSFNSPFGACPTCSGLGLKRMVNEELILGDPSLTLLEGVVLPWGEPDGYLRKVILPGLAEALQFDLKTPWANSAAGMRCCTAWTRSAPAAARRAKAAKKSAAKKTATKPAAKVALERHRSQRAAPLRRDQLESTRGPVELEAFMLATPCPSCHGTRLKPESLAVTIEQRNLGEVVAMSVAESLGFFRAVPVRAPGKPIGLDPEIAGPILKEVTERLGFLVDVGLDYLTLESEGRDADRAARRSASGSRRRSARSCAACSTSSTSRASACTRATTSGCCTRSRNCVIWATP
ncbi:MAG: hypothetical protein U5K74_14280 [Gemmatimonadaceae bacterium]|nr:hypothetical protein [Gemmatimonadaceae bacterium]